MESQSPTPAANNSRDAEWMRLALQLAHRGQGWVEPNPMVGCVLVSAAGNEIGRGYHARFGQAHAERAAIADAIKRGHRQQLAGATAYVTLEPCCHHGKTPPCTDALIEHQISRVVVAMLDPFEQVQGKGCRILQSHGIRVDVGIEVDAARSLNAPYLKFMQSGMPWIIGKWAMSIDGKIATRTGHSQWISGQESRTLVHLLRSRVDAIMVGIGTALADDPLLTARDVESRRVPLRIVADSSLRIRHESQLVKTAQQLPTLILAGPDANPEARKRLEEHSVQVYVSDQNDPVQRLRRFLKYLAAECSVTNLLVEGGAALFGSMLEADLLDQIEVFLAPIIIGGVHAPSPVQGLGIENLGQATAFEFNGIQRLGQDIHLSGVRQPKYPS